MFGFRRRAADVSASWEAAGRTHSGRVRPVNEDAWRVAAGAGPWVVADGMGGHRGGAEASRLAVVAVAEGVERGRALVGVRLVQAVEAANRQVWRAARADPELAGMGCTLVAAALEADTLQFAHVGDARGYVVGSEGLRAVTRDHSYVGELVARGQLLPEQAATHPKRNVVTRAVGVDAEVEVEHTVVPLAGVTGLLLCSDGLWGVVPGPEMERIVLASPDPTDACEKLVTAALDAGAPDNVTAVVVRRR